MNFLYSLSGGLFFGIGLILAAEAMKVLFHFSICH